MEKWEYIVGVQLSRPREKEEISLDERTIIDHQTPPEIWLNKKGIEGYELVAVIHRHDYTEFFMKRRVNTGKSLSSELMEKEAVKLASQAEKQFADNDFEHALESP